MSNCQSCGMPMMKPEDHGGGRLDNVHCQYCTDAQGNLLPKDQVREKMIQFHLQNLSKTQSQAEIDVDHHMSLMPAWKTVPGSPAAGQPFVQEPSAAPEAIPADDQPPTAGLTQKPFWQAGETPAVKPQPQFSEPSKDPAPGFEPAIPEPVGKPNSTDEAKDWQSAPAEPAEDEDLAVSE